MSCSVATPEAQYYALCVLGFLTDLFTSSPRDEWRREDLLVVLAELKNVSELFKPETVTLYEVVDSGFQSALNEEGEFEA